MEIWTECLGCRRPVVFFFFLGRSRKAFLLLIIFSASPLQFVPPSLFRCIPFLWRPLVSLHLFFFFLIRMNHSTLNTTSRLCVLPPSVELFLFVLPFILNFDECWWIYFALNIEDYPLNILGTLVHTRNI